MNARGGRISPLSFCGIENANMEVLYYDKTKNDSENTDDNSSENDSESEAQQDQNE